MDSETGNEMHWRDASYGMERWQEGVLQGAFYDGPTTPEGPDALNMRAFPCLLLLAYTLTLTLLSRGGERHSMHVVPARDERHPRAPAPLYAPHNRITPALNPSTVCAHIS
jgi:hypothetical protein